MRTACKLTWTAVVLLALQCALVHAQPPSYQRVWMQSYFNDGGDDPSLAIDLGDSLLLIGRRGTPDLHQRPMLMYLDADGTLLDTVLVLNNDSTEWQKVTGTLADAWTVFLTGTAYTADSVHHGFLAKATLSGEVLWLSVLSYPGAFYQQLDACAPLPGGGVVAVGRADSLTNPGQTKLYWVVWADSSGQIYRSRTYGLPGWTNVLEATCLHVIDDGGLLVAGGTYLGGRPAMLMRLDAQGEAVWTSQIEPHWDPTWTAAMTVLPSGDIVLGGHTLGGSRDLWIARYSSEGDLRWRQTWPRPSAQTCLGLVYTREGALLLLGLSQEVYPDGPFWGEFAFLSVGLNGAVREFRVENAEDYFKGPYGGGLLQFPDSSFLAVTAGGQYFGGGFYYDGYLAARFTRDRFVPIPPSAPALLLPPDGASLGGGAVTFQWAAAVDSNAYDTVAYTFHIAGQEHIADIDAGHALQHTVAGTLLDSLGGPNFTWQVSAHSLLPDTIVQSEQTFGFLFEYDSADPGLHDEIAPSEFALYPCYPNPFNPVTEIRFDLPREVKVRLAVYDVLGREVAVLKNGVMNAGSHRVAVDANGWASGEYIVRLETPEHTQTQKVVLVK